MVQNRVSNDFTWVQSQQNPMDFWPKSPPASVTPNPKRRYSVRYVAMTADAAISNVTSAGCVQKTAVMTTNTAFLPVMSRRCCENEMRSKE